MKQNTFNQKQREMFARLLTEARKQEEVELKSDSSFDSRIESDFLPKLAKEHGAWKLIEKVRKLTKELDDARQELSDLGFSCGQKSISLEWDPPEALSEALAAAKRSARKERQATLRKYDRAILGVWVVEDIQEARKIVEKLL